MSIRHIPGLSVVNSFLMFEGFNLKIDDEISLGLYTRENAEEVYNKVMANYAHLYEFSPWLDENYSLERALAFADLCRQQAKDGTQLPVTIYYHGEYVGGSGFHAINWDSRSTEIGYWLAEKHTGKGIITRVCRGLLDYAFGELRLNRIVLKASQDNVKSLAIAERLGFTKEGTERESAIRHGRYVDFVVYSMLAREWRERKSLQDSPHLQK